MANSPLEARDQNSVYEMAATLPTELAVEAPVVIPSDEPIDNWVEISNKPLLHQLTNAIAYYYVDPDERLELQQDLDMLMNGTSSGQPQRDPEFLPKLIEHLDSAWHKTVRKLQQMGIENPTVFLDEVIPLVVRLDNYVRQLRTMPFDERVRRIQEIKDSSEYQQLEADFHQLELQEKRIQEKQPDHRVVVVSEILQELVDLPTGVEQLDALVSQISISPNGLIALNMSELEGNHPEKLQHFWRIMSTYVNNALRVAEVAALERLQMPTNQPRDVQTNHKVFFLAGMPGSGKEAAYQTLADTLARNYWEPLMNADPDPLKPQLWNLLITLATEFDDPRITAADRAMLRGPYQPSNQAHVEAVHWLSAFVNKAIFIGALKKNYSVVDQGMLSNLERYLAQVQLAKAANFEVSLKLVDSITLAEMVRRFVAHRDRGFPISHLIDVVKMNMNAALLIENGVELQPSA